MSNHVQDTKKSGGFLKVNDEILQLNQLTYFQKLLLAKIDNLDNDERGCFASNPHLAMYFNCTEKHISKSITKLFDFGYVERIVSKGNKRQLTTKIPNLQYDNTDTPISVQVIHPEVNTDTPTSVPAMHPEVKHKRKIIKKNKRKEREQRSHFNYLKKEFPLEVKEIGKKYKMSMEESQKCIDKFNNKYSSYKSVSIIMLDSYTKEWHSRIRKELKHRYPGLKSF